MLSSSFVTSAAAVVRRLPSQSVANRMCSTPSCSSVSHFPIRPVDCLKQLHRHRHLPNPRRHFVSSTPPKQQRLTLRPVSPREGRYDLTTASKRRPGSGGGGGGGRGRFPSYVYVTGGVVVVGSITIYMQFQDYAPLTNRRRWIASSPEMEKEMGDQNYKQLLKQFEGKILPKSHPSTVAVQRVGSRIFKAASIFAKQYNLHYFDTKNVTFTVVESEQANAFVLPGNHVFVLTGIFKYAKTEDELGGILGHEMAHNLARHQGEKISSTFVVGMIARLSLLFDPSGGLMLIFLPAAELLSELPNSRTQEMEADRIGMHLAAEACFDPEALGRVFLRMDAAGSDGSDKTLVFRPPEFLSTHPNDESRIAQMQKWLPENKRIFNQEEGERCRRLRREIAMANMMGKSWFTGSQE